MQKQEFSEVNQSTIGGNSTRQERQSYALWETPLYLANAYSMTSAAKLYIFFDVTLRFLILLYKQGDYSLLTSTKNSNKRILRRGFFEQKSKDIETNKKSLIQRCQFQFIQFFLCHYQTWIESILYIIYKYIIYNINNLLTIYKYPKAMSF